MPIHDVGYRNWSGRLTHPLSRWWIITEAGVAAALKSAWLRRAMLAAWIPVLLFGSIILMFERMLDPSTQMMLNPGEVMQAEEGGALAQASEELEQVATQKRNVYVVEQISDQFPFLDSSRQLEEAAREGDKGKMRRFMWSLLLATFLRYPQGIMTLLLVGLIVPPLISRDVRSRAFLLYYSRPITRIEYMVGKFAIPASLLTMITMVPALALYMFGLMLSPDLSVVWDTWDLPIRIVVATLFCVLPVCSLSLLFSSMTQESRFAGFAWFAVWGLGAVVWLMIYGIRSAEMGPEGVSYMSNWSLVSLYSTISRVQAWLFGLDGGNSSIIPSVVMLMGLTALSLIWMYRRISAPVNI